MVQRTRKVKKAPIERVKKKPVKKEPKIRDEEMLGDPVIEDTDMKAPDAEVTDFRKYLNVYKFNCVLPGSGETVHFKPITAAHFKKLLTVNTDKLDAMTDAIYGLFQDLLIDYDIDNMLIKDRPYVTLEIRKQTKGSDYSFQFNCPKCKSQSIINIDLDKAKVTKKPLDVDPEVVLDENITVFMKYLQIADEKEIFKHLDESSKVNDLAAESELALWMLAASIEYIKTPDGKQRPSLLEKKYFVENIPNFLYDKILAWHDEFDFGVDMEIQAKCKNKDCQHTEKVDASPDNFFL
jgi:hypothetical protein